MSVPQKQRAPFGTWSSPITPSSLSSSPPSPESLIVDTFTHHPYHLSRLPLEAGRVSLFDSVSHEEITKGDWNVRTRVHEYGGGAVCVRNWVVYFSHVADGRVYELDRSKDGATPRAVTPENPDYRYADIAIHPVHPHLLLAVLEDHTPLSQNSTPLDVVNTLVLIDTLTASIKHLFDDAYEGHRGDFYASPKWNEDGSRVCWVQWDHPMPWDASEVHVASLSPSSFNETGSAKPSLEDEQIIGPSHTESAIHQHWLTRDALLFNSDKSGYQNPYILDLSTSPPLARPLLEQNLEEDFSEPMWILGESYAAVLSPTEIVFAAMRKGRGILYDAKPIRPEENDGVSSNFWRLREIETPFVRIGSLRSTGMHSAMFLGEQVDAPPAVVSLVAVSASEDEDSVSPTTKADEKKADSPKAKKHLLSSLTHRNKGRKADGTPSEAKKEHKETDRHPKLSLWEVREFSTLPEKRREASDKRYFSCPYAFSFRNGTTSQEAHAVFYPPTNPLYFAQDDEKCPCIVSIHGGPTAMSTQGLKMKTQFFTSRGVAWVDVNYAGSTGYGRRYIERLDGNWGLSDVTDAQSCAIYLSSAAALTEAKLPVQVDPTRIVITGGSAGGYTVLQSICTPSPSSAGDEVFAGAMSSYGISNLFNLVKDTHKFEGRYMEKLIGCKINDSDEKTREKAEKVYRERSPVFNAEKIKTPLLLLQGSIDPIVPPNQSKEMARIIESRGGKVKLVMFEGESHGWRKAETIEHAVEEEWTFLRETFGIPAEKSKGKKKKDEALSTSEHSDDNV